MQTEILNLLLLQRLQHIKLIGYISLNYVKSPKANKLPPEEADTTT